MFSSTQLEEVSSLSLASLSFKNSNDELKEQKLDDLPSDNFTENDFNIAWKKFCDIEKEKGNKNILSLLNMNNPTINNNIISISTVNKMNFKYVTLNSYNNKINHDVVVGNHRKVNLLIEPFNLEKPLEYFKDYEDDKFIFLYEKKNFIESMVAGSGIEPLTSGL